MNAAVAVGISRPYVALLICPTSSVLVYPVDVHVHIYNLVSVGGDQARLRNATPTIFIYRFNLS